MSSTTQPRARAGGSLAAADSAGAGGSSGKRLLVHVVVNGRTASASEPLVPIGDSWAAGSALHVAPAYEPRGAVLALELIPEVEVPSFQSCIAPAPVAAPVSASAPVPLFREVEDAERCSAFALACFGLVRCTRAGGADRFLLIRRGRGVRVLPGRISLPGGFLNLAAVLPGGTHVGEGLEECVRREVEEETGVIIPPSAPACATVAITHLAASALAASAHVDAAAAAGAASRPSAPGACSSFRLLGMGSAPGGRQHTIMFVFLVTVPDADDDAEGAAVAAAASGGAAAVSGGAAAVSGGAAAGVREAAAGAHAVAAPGASRVEGGSGLAASEACTACAGAGPVVPPPAARACGDAGSAAAAGPTAPATDRPSALPRLFASAAPRPGEVEEVLVWSPAQLAAELDAPSPETFPSIIANILRPHFGGAARRG